MNIIKLTSLLVCFSLITGCVFHVGGKGKSANVTLNETIELDATSLTQLNIDAGAGSLTIIGSETNTIKVDAYIRTTEDKQYKLTLRQSGSHANLTAQSKGYGNWYGNSPSIDLTITLPKALALDIDDGSGDVNISRMNNTIILVDGSGSIDISRINGNLNIQDGSGWIQLENINGDIKLDDGSGEISIINTNGNVNIEDGSGGLTVTNTTGKVAVDDGSGDIEINSAGGLKIIEAGSGGLKVSNITGEMDIDS